MINHESKMPYYTQLKEALLGKIEKGVYAKGEKLPSEMELALQNGISRPTVRQAIAELVQEGYLEKRRGIGTFVASPLITGNAAVFKTFAEEMAAHGRQHEARIIRAHTIGASGKTAEELQVKQGGSIFEIVRLRLADGEPLVIRTSFVPSCRFPELLKKDLEKKPLYELLANNGAKPARATLWFQATAAIKEEARLLQIAEGDPLSLWNGLVYDEKNQPIEKFKAVYVGSRFRFEVKQTRSSSLLANQAIEPGFSPFYF